MVAPSGPIVTPKGSGTSDYYGKGNISAPCGTSFSAPYVSGAAALLLGADGDLTTDDIREVLIRTADDLGTTGYDVAYGHGLIKIDEAIDYVSSPRTLHHGTETSFTVDSLDARTQEFRQVRGLNGTDTLKTYWAEVYEMTVTIDISSQSDSVVAVWARPRLSTGYPNEDRIDARLFGSVVKVDSYDQDEIVLKSHTYHVFTDDQTQCLGWFPVVPTGESSCGAPTKPAKFDYTYLTIPSGSIAEQWVRNDLFLRVDASPDRIQLRLDHDRTRQVVSFEAYDASGRRVWTTQAEGGDRSVIWDTSGLSSGIYFVRAASGDATTTRKVVVVR